MANDQISNAGGTPDILVTVFSQTNARLPSTNDSWWNFVNEMTAREDGNEAAYYAYPTLREKINAATGQMRGGQQE
jgi:hypothetical protein